MTDFDHTEIEKELIESYGGTPQEKFGTDGTINGAPTEVRLAKEEDRFRLNKETHSELVEQEGTYIFDDLGDNQPPKQVDADTVDDRLSEDWHSDRGYMHQFVSVDSFF
ncbi:hypothetical protein [Haloquadratum walsbyi]|uniref:Uncharacterized protein n=1 Tax=Haloquadratum walsbyi (strain DSM 16854 / JCM 12705 / C23) TaxID=768065 RepID=G0LNF6_HALWC|nr:hypothetical protein [Haloquadratum walsbyi]CCC41962.1 conserved hypothetical protein [Haloquadratum walsbyi C23]